MSLELRCRERLLATADGIRAVAVLDALEARIAELELERAHNGLSIIPMNDLKAHQDAMVEWLTKYCGMHICTEAERKVLESMAAGKETS